MQSCMPRRRTDCHRLSCLLVVVCLFIVTTHGASEPTAEQSAFFEKKIRPILVERCYECHSEQAKKVKGNLLLDSREAALKGGDSGPAIVPGEPKKSLLIKAVRYRNEDLQMPPKHKLDEEQIAALEEWVRMGAPDPRKKKPATLADASPFSSERANHWSFQPISNPKAPAVKNRRWVKNDVDRFILGKLEAKGLGPSLPAAKRTLIRRATFDLIGLPPTPDQVNDFLKDRSPRAFEKVIDRLLASRHYGERWGRHWLDVVRYADTAGDSSDYPVPQAGKYRDYVIKCFNEDKPYDQFLREQIAGDLLPSGSELEKHEKIIATGYIALARRFSVNPESVQHLTIEDTIDNLGKATLGLSVSCARCHDHKYDPISSADYYALYGIFSSTRYPFAGSENEKKQRNLVPLIGETELEALLRPFKEQLAPLDSEVKRFETEMAELRKRSESSGGGEAEKTNSDKPERTLTVVREELRKAREKRDKFAKTAPFYEKAFAVIEGKPKNARIHIRGEPGKQGDEAPRRFLQILGGEQLPLDEKGSGRRQLAEWVSDPKNPLTARVMVNRIWQYHFGKGLVQTPNDFGLRGKAPTHPELLDYLATRFIESGWSVKAMHKLIMLSQTYRQTSGAADGSESARAPTSAATMDPNNELLWKFDRRRLDAEAIRDAMLFVSGELDTSTCVTHAFPPEEKWNYTQHNPFNAVYPSKYRSVYLMQQRIKKHPYLELFDGADPNSSSATRVINTTPLQALFMMNDAFMHEQAGHFARRIIEITRDDKKRISTAYELAFARLPSQEELQTSQRYIREYGEKLKVKSVPEEERPMAAWTSFARALLSHNEFVYID